MEILPLIIALGVLNGVQGTFVNISSDAPIEAFDGGLQVKIKCLVELSVQDVISIRKKTPDSNSPVTTNQIVEEAFRDTGRYSVYYNYDGDTSTGEVELTINNFDVADAGNYFCRLLSGQQEKESAERSLIVKVPVDDVRMAQVLPNGTLQEVQDNEVVSLTYGTRGGIACIVSLKSYVNVPTVNVSVNGMVSSDFTFSSVKQSESDAMTYEFIHQYMTSEPDYHIHGNNIKCEASTPGHQQRSATVKGEATFKPVIVCDKLKTTVPLGDDTEVICTVYSNPAAQITLEYGAAYSDNSLDLDANRKEKFEFITISGDDLAKRTVAVKVYRITEGLINFYKYRIKATSTLGIKTQSFTFEEKYVSGSSHPFSSWSLLSLTIILSLLSFKPLSS